MWQFFAVHFWTIAATFGAVGIAAFAACFVVFGWSFGAVLTAALNVIKELIKFFETPLGEIIGFLAICALVAFAVDVRRTRIDAALTDQRVQEALLSAAKEADNARVHRDQTIEQQVKADADRRIKAITDEKAKLQERADADEKALQERPGCTVTDGDLAAKRLRKRP